MTASTIKVRVVRKSIVNATLGGNPAVKVRVIKRTSPQIKILTRFPSLVSVLSPLALDRSGGNFLFSLDINSLITALSDAFQPVENNIQEITAGPAAAVDVLSNVVLVNQAVAGAITLNLPPAETKVSGVLIADWKFDAGTNNIRIVPSGTQKIQGRADWTIAGDGGSIFLRPLPGIGYAI